MLTNLSPFNTIRFLHNKPKHHSSSLSPQSLTPDPSSNLSFQIKKHFLHQKIKNPFGNKKKFETLALSDFGFGGFESAQSVLEAVSVLTAIIVVHESGHFLAASLQGIHVGLPVQEAFPGVIVPEVRPFSAASRDGLLAGDVILSVNNIELPKTVPNSVSQVVDVIKKNPKSTVFFKVDRGGKDFLIKVTPDQNLDGSGRIGVQLAPNVRVLKEKPKDVLEAFNFTGREFWGLTFNVVDSLKQTFLNFSQSASKVSGPVAIIAVGAEVAKSNIDGLYQFAAILNLNLAVINLLPLPALDGGTLALILVEAIRGGRKLPLEIEQGIMSSGITLVFVLGVFLIIRDTLNLDFIKDLL